MIKVNLKYRFFTIVILLLFQCAKQPPPFKQLNPLDSNNTISYSLRLVDTYLTTTSDSFSCAYDMFVDTSSHILYLANGCDGLLILDISDPAQVTLNAKLSLNNAVSIDAEDGIAFVLEDSTSHSNAQSVIIDIDDPFSPQIIGYFKGPDSISYENVVIENKYVFLGSRFGIEVYDISNPSNITSITKVWEWLPLSITYFTCKAFVSGDTVFIADPNNCELHIFTGVPADPIEEGVVGLPSIINDIVVAEQVAYLSLTNDQIVLIDIEDLRAPKISGYRLISGEGTELSIANNITYVIYDILENIDVNVFIHVGGGLLAVNTRYPEKINIMSDYQDIFEPEDIYTNADNIFVTNKKKGLLVFALDSY